MDRHALLSDLARSVKEATARRDWDGLVRSNARMAETLPLLAAQGKWLAAEQEALAELARAHRESTEYCSRELVMLEDKLNEMRVNREGWLAYALIANPEENQS